MRLLRFARHWYRPMYERRGPWRNLAVAAHAPRAFVPQAVGQLQAEEGIELPHGKQAAGEIAPSSRGSWLAGPAPFAPPPPSPKRARAARHPVDDKYPSTGPTTRH